MKIKVQETGKGVDYHFIKFEDVYGEVMMIKGWQYQK